MKLYELAEQYEAILLEVAASDGVLSEELEQRLEAIGDALAAKLDSCAAMVRTLEGEAEVYAAEAKRMVDKRRAAEAATDRIKGYMQAALYAAGERKVKGARFTVAIQANPPAVQLSESDPAKLPPEFVRTKLEIDKTAIKKALEVGTVLPFAELVQGEGIRIR